MDLKRHRRVHPESSLNGSQMQLTENIDIEEYPINSPTPTEDRHTYPGFKPPQDLREVRHDLGTSRKKAPLKSKDWEEEKRKRSNARPWEDGYYRTRRNNEETEE